MPHSYQPSNSSLRVPELSHLPPLTATMTSESSDRSRKSKKQVRFQVYNATNLATMKKMREDKLQQLETMERERDLSIERARSALNNSQSTINIDLVNQSLLARQGGSTTSISQPHTQQFYNSQPTENMIIEQNERASSAYDGGEGNQMHQHSREVSQEIVHGEFVISNRVESQIDDQPQIQLKQVAQRESLHQGAPDIVGNNPFSPARSSRASVHSILKNSHIHNSSQISQKEYYQSEPLNPPFEGEVTNLGMSKVLKKYAEEQLQRLSPVRSIQSYVTPNPYQSSQNVNYIVEKLQDMFYIGQSRLKVDAFDELKYYYEETQTKILRQQARCDVYATRRFIQYWKYGIYKQQQQAIHKRRAQLWRDQKEKILKQIIIDKIQKVLNVERQWLFKVKKEFSIQKKESIFQKWFTYLKYRRAKKNRILNTYYAFLKQCRMLADITEEQMNKMVEYHKQKIFNHGFKAFLANRNLQKQRKILENKAFAFRKQQLDKLGFKILSENRKEQKRIKGDIFLRHGQTQDFFTVKVCRQTGISENYITQQIDSKNKKKMGLNLTKREMLNIKIVQ